MAYTTINKPGLHFNTKLYAGNSSTQSISGVGFQPDWVWIKDREMLLGGINYLMLLEELEKYYIQMMVLNKEMIILDYLDLLQMVFL